MKIKRTLIALSSLALALSAAEPKAFAAKNSEKITILSPVTVGTTQLPAAEYKVTWNETGSNAQVTLKHGKSVVTLPAKVVEQKHDAITLLTDDKGEASILLGIDLSKVSVDFESSPASGE